VIVLTVALAIFACGGALAAALTRWPRAASLAGAGSAVMGSAAGVIFAAQGLRGETVHAALPWRVLSGGVVLERDALSTFFLLPIFVLGAIAAAYGHSYLLAHRGKKALGVPWLALNLLLASMALVVTARHAVLFLVAWEVMSLSSYVLVVFEHERPEVRRAGWIYLIAAHVGAAFLMAMFLILSSTTGTLVLGPKPAALGGAARAFVLLFALAGFGVKAGLVPLHVWLPEAHAAAPSHVSALMSGVMTKMGVYGILRVTLLAGPAPAWWGSLLIVAGLAGGLFGVALASYQRDIKRALAYSTIENVGLVVLGLGLGFWGHASGHPAIGTLGLYGGLLHAWNHTLMKGLLFLGAGTIVHATGTRDIERLGGLLRRAPIGGALFVVGCVAIAGLPPLNGFTGEWLLYLSLLDAAIAHTEGAAAAFMLAVGILSAIGALAALCFVRLCSAILLGQARSKEAESAHEAGPGLLLPMGALAAACVLIGARPGAVVAELGEVIEALLPANPAVARPVPSSLVALGYADLAVWGLALIGAVVLIRVSRARPEPTEETWGCGYAAPTTRMQYTGSSFAQLLTGSLLPKALRPRVQVVRPAGLFPAPGRLDSDSEDPLTRSVYEPAMKSAADRFSRLRWLQQGQLPLYVLYIVVAVVAGLGWTYIQGWGAG
jgi:hydrogenase-4 component B